MRLNSRTGAIDFRCVVDLVAQLVNLLLQLVDLLLQPLHFSASNGDLGLVRLLVVRKVSWSLGSRDRGLQVLAGLA